MVDNIAFELVLKQVLKKPMSELTLKDKEILYEYYLNEAKDNFGMALDYAEELGKLKELMVDAKCLVFDVEDKGIEIGGMN